MNLKSIIAASMLLCTPAYAQNFQRDYRPEVEDCKVFGVPVDLVKAEGNVHWRSYDTVITNSPARPVHILDGYAEMPIKLSIWNVENISLGFIERIDTLNHIIESIVYSYSDDKDQLTDYAYGKAAKEHLDLERIAWVENEVLDYKTGLAFNPDSAKYTPFDTKVLPFEALYMALQKDIASKQETKRWVGVRFGLKTHYIEVTMGNGKLHAELTYDDNGERKQIIPHFNSISLEQGPDGLPDVVRINGSYGPADIVAKATHVK